MAISRADLPQSAKESALCDALADLREAAEYAEEEDFPIPSKSAIANAELCCCARYTRFPRCILKCILLWTVRLPFMSPNGRGRSVLLLCDSVGGALCLANLESEHRRKSYPTADTLPDKFLRQALVDVTH